jgi:hypothetical protein
VVGNEGVFKFSKVPNKRVQIRKVQLINNSGKTSSEIIVGEPFSVDIEYDVNEATVNAFLGISCFDERDNPIFFSSDADNNRAVLVKREKGKYRAVFTFPKSSNIFLNKGEYHLSIVFGHPGYSLYDKISDISLRLIESNEITPLLVTSLNGERPGAMVLNTKWKQQKVQ